MKIIPIPEQKKINFVDKQNCFVGFDLQHQCSESFGWFISDVAYSPKIINEKRFPDEVVGSLPEEIVDFGDWIFVPTYVFYSEESPSYGDRSDISQGGMLRFKLEKPVGRGEKYLHIFNFHLGYYAHGFKINFEGIL